MYTFRMFDRNGKQVGQSNDKEHALRVVGRWGGWAEQMVFGCWMPIATETVYEES